LIIGIAWGLTLPLDILGGLVAPLVLAIADISLVGLLQRTLTQWLLQDREKRRHKKRLGRCFGTFAQGPKLKKLMVFKPFELGFPSSTHFTFVFMWVAAVFLAHACSARPYG